MTQIDYEHDSLAEIVLKQSEALQEQQETIEQQGYRILYLLSENLGLREDANSVIAHEHEKLMDALLVVEGWVFRWMSAGRKTLDSEALHRILTECFAYSEEGVTPPWLEAGRRILLEDASQEDGE